MLGLDKKLTKHIELLVERYPGVKPIESKIIAAYLKMEDCYEKSGKILIAGNGGSASDSEHMAAELMKGFKRARKVDGSFAEKLKSIDQERGNFLAECLEGALPAIPLVSQGPLATAFINDVGSGGVFAQQLIGYGKAGDIFLGISTSGYSKNIVNAAITARAMGISVIALTGKKGGELARFADVVVNVPEEETYMVQEFHLPIYHCWCLMLEDRFFDKASKENSSSGQ